MPNDVMKLKPLDIGDSATFKKFDEFIPRGLCEFSFANLIIWRDFDRPSFVIIDDNLCVNIDPLDEDPFFLEPVGAAASEKAFCACMKHAGRLSRVSEKFAASVDRSMFKTFTLRDHYDYVYKTIDMANLAGRKYDGKRNHAKRFETLCPGYMYIPLEQKHACEAMKLLDVWCAYKKSQRNGLVLSELAYECQCAAVARAFESYDELNLSGGALINNGEMLGFVMGSRLHADLMCLHFSYTRPEVPGAYQVLMREACRRIFHDFEFVNLEQDLGINGLRRTKTSYHPFVLKKKFGVEFA